MAEWYEIDLEFTEDAPTEVHLSALRNTLHELDYDFPTLGTNGLTEAHWRSPVVSLDKILLVIHNMGFPCRGRMVRDNGEPYGYCADCGNWIISKEFQQPTPDEV